MKRQIDVDGILFGVVILRHHRDRRWVVRSTLGCVVTGNTPIKIVDIKNLCSVSS